MAAFVARASSGGFPRLRGDVGRSGGHAVHWREAALRGGGLDEDFTVPRALGMVGIRLLGRGGKSHGEFCGGDGILGLEAGDRAVAERGAGVGVGARDARAWERLRDGGGAGGHGVGRCEYQVGATGAGEDGVQYSSGAYAIDSCGGEVRIQATSKDDVQRGTDDLVRALGPRFGQKAKGKSYSTWLEATRRHL